MAGMAEDAWILHFDNPRATLNQVGGKGANLAKLAQAGLPVPGGFLIATPAYRAYVESNHLDAVIESVLARLADGATIDLTLLEAASDEIRSAFTSGEIPEALTAAILTAYQAMGSPLVAVRSSATAEDLPNLSFAGQQDTYLNVARDSLLRAVIGCWASLWTARAIGYRARNHISSRSNIASRSTIPGIGNNTGDSDDDTIGLAVVVQEMVQSEASGVLFTANPLTGMRAESVVDATLGLGEALVSGQVEPDHYVVASVTGAIRERTVGTKALVIRGVEGGGTESITDPAGATTPALTDEQVRQVVALGQRVQTLYGGVPQDIEWGWADGKLYLLQSRPITSLFPLPAGAVADPPSVLFSFAAVQGVFDPFTPLGLSAFALVSACMARTLGYDFAPGKVPAIKFAANRMWIDITPLLGNEPGRRFLSVLLPNVVPAAADAVMGLGYLREGSASSPLPSREALSHLRRLAGPLLRKAPAALRDPDRARDELLARVDMALATFAQRSRQCTTLRERLDFVDTLFAEGIPLLFRSAIPALLPGLICQGAFIQIAGQAGIETTQALNVTRGMPHNVTTEMDLALWKVAQSIRGDAEAFQRFTDTSAADLAAAWSTGALPNTAQIGVSDFLKQYGMRGIAEIDMGRKRWREEPTQVMQMVQNYLRVDDPMHAPDAVYARAQREAQTAIEEVVTALRTQGKEKLARAAAFAASRARALAGLREYPKFTIIRLMGIARELLDATYTELAAQGVLAEAEDGVWLTLEELRAVDAGYAINWKALVVERKATWAREQQRRLLPDLLLGDGRVFYGGASAEGDESSSDPSASGDATLRGQPVSAGSVEGVCHVVLQPHSAALVQGEILVCPATDPAWTPLFLSAGGLIMEVGGMMTHGSVVAREYGIPAVVGVRNATTRLATGQRVRLNGSTGTVTVLPEEEPVP